MVVSPESVSILYVDDDVLVMNAMCQVIELFGNVTIYQASNAREGLDKYIILRPDIVITDMVMPGENGIWLVEQIRKINSKVIIFIMSAYYTEVDTYNNIGVIAIPKPIDCKYFNSIIANSIEIVSLNRKINRLVDAVESSNLRRSYLGQIPDSDTGSPDSSG